MKLPFWEDTSRLTGRIGLLDVLIEGNSGVSLARELFETTVYFSLEAPAADGGDLVR